MTVSSGWESACLRAVRVFQPNDLVFYSYSPFLCRDTLYGLLKECLYANIRLLSVGSTSSVKLQHGNFANFLSHISDRPGVAFGHTVPTHGNVGEGSDFKS